MGVKVGSQFEMVRYTSADDGATWTARQLTFDSADLNIIPMQVWGHGPVRVVWERGAHTSDLSYSLGTMGSTV